MSLAECFVNLASFVSLFVVFFARPLFKKSNLYEIDLVAFKLFSHLFLLAEEIHKSCLSSVAFVCGEMEHKSEVEVPIYITKWLQIKKRLVQGQNSSI